MSLWVGRKMSGLYELGSKKRDWDNVWGFLNKPNYYFETAPPLSRSLKRGECVKIKGKIKIELED